MSEADSVMEETYRRHLPQLQAWPGWYALVCERRLGGVFSTYAAASRAWMAMYAPVPALIRRIEPAPLIIGDESAAPAAAGGTAPPDAPPDAPPAPEVQGPQDAAEYPLRVACGWALRRRLAVRPPAKLYAA